jgi:hypothetical protein
MFTHHLCTHMELTSDINIVPGLSGLNLNILHAIDMHMIDNAKHTLVKWIQKEHRTLISLHFSVKQFDMFCVQMRL